MSIINRLRSVAYHPLNRDNKINALFRFLKWQVGIRLVPGDVVYEWINGARFVVAKGEMTLTGNVYCGMTEFTEMCFLIHVLRDHDLFVDVGANVGSFTILAGVAVGACVIAFEPVPASFSRLDQNIRLNRMENRVTALNLAVGAAEGDIPFTSDEGAMNHVAPPEERRSGNIVVPISTLDSTLGEQSPALMKIDVEGYETPALEGAAQTLQRESLHSVIIELAGHGERYGFDERKIVGIMAGYGFRPFAYDPFSRTLHGLRAKNPDSLNTIFIRDEDRVRERLRNAAVIDVHGMRI